ncbi:hypothetical protein B7P43_G11874, partial [Cryptotermes secundus]
DERFLQEAKKYMSLKMSDLDDCQHRVVVNIHKRCLDLTEEELARLSVNLLNCQSAVEERQHFPCTTKMVSCSESSTDNSVFKHFLYCDHGCISRMCCSVVLLKIPVLSFFGIQLIEEGIQYVINVPIRVHGIVEKYGANDSPRAYSTPHTHLFTISCTTVTLYGRNLINFVAVRADPSETPVSCAKRLNDFRGLIYEASLEFSSQVNERHENHKQLREDLQTVMEQVALLWQRVAFIRAPMTTRAFLLLLVPLNLGVTYTHGDAAALNFPSMTILILASTAALVSRSHSPMQSVSAAASSRGDFLRPDERVRILTSMPDRNLGEGSSGSGEVAFGRDHFAEVS